MSGIRILDELSRELKSERQTLKVPTNWLDRLRSKKGFPTEDSPDLGTFLKSKANTIPPIPRFHENCQTLPLRRRPRKQAHPTKVVRVCPPSTSTSTAAAAAATFPNIIVLSDDSDEENAQQQQSVAVAVAADPAAVADEEEEEEEAEDGDDHDEGGPPHFPIEPIQLAVQEEEEEEEELDEEEEEEEEVSTITDETVISG